MALSGSTARILKDALKQWVGVDKPSSDIEIHSSEDGRVLLRPSDLSPEQLKRIQEVLSTELKPSPNVLELSKQAALSEQPNRPPSVATSAQAEIVSLALAVDPDSVFRDARKRTSLVFQLNLAFAIILGIILLAGIGGSLYSALVLGKSTWATAFGGISAADLIGVYAFKPLAAINAALVSATRLDNMQLRLKTQLEQCSKYSSVAAKVSCQNGVWEAIQKELASLG
jgi:hypothetical protein